MKNLIKVERARCNLSQSDLAEKVGVTRQTIYAIENRRFTPSVILAFKIAQALNISIENLFELEEED
ncbi:MAG: helix-turn-helix transcriptional regulator [Fulvivirga sp.]|uniref:helix-turn-helix transcriptional regulator n=1 Tax=Fulvivirga sp. TaxID=1931237 RepID=UPI0032EC5D7B